MNFFDTLKNKIKRKWRKWHMIYYFDNANAGERKKKYTKRMRITVSM